MKSTNPRIQAFLDQNSVAHDGLWVDFAERLSACVSPPKIFQDEMEAIEAQLNWAIELNSYVSPFEAELHCHIGEGGATTAYYQDAKLVGLAARFRDPMNRTHLVCVDLR